MKIFYHENLEPYSNVFSVIFYTNELSSPCSSSIICGLIRAKL